MKQKTFFINFKGLSAAKNCLRPEESASLIFNDVIAYIFPYPFTLLALNCQPRATLTRFPRKSFYCWLALLPSFASINSQMSNKAWKQKEIFGSSQQLSLQLLYCWKKEGERVVLKNMYCFHDFLSKVSRNLCCSNNLFMQL